MRGQRGLIKIAALLALLLAAGCASGGGPSAVGEDAPIVRSPSPSLTPATAAQIACHQLAKSLVPLSAVIALGLRQHNVPSSYVLVAQLGPELVRLSASEPRQLSLDVRAAARMLGGSLGSAIYWVPGFKFSAVTLDAARRWCAGIDAAGGFPPINGLVRLGIYASRR